MDATVGLEQIAADITHLAMPFLTAVIIIVILLLVKDGCMKIAKGVLFRITSNLKEGDSVIIDGEDATIVKMGLFTTTFGIYKNGGEDVRYLWRLVYNDRIPFTRIEKVIKDKAEIHNIIANLK